MPVERYLRAADDVGALRTIGGGRLVGGEYLDAARDRIRYLITYCDDHLVRDGSLAQALPALVRAEAPAAERLLLRLNAGLEPTAPWSRHTTYLRYASAGGRKSEAGEDTAAKGLTVVQAASRHDDLVLGWLVSALEEAARSQGEPADVPGASQVARQVLDDPGRRTYVALCEGTPIGHATLLCGEQDDVTGEDFVELFDVLVTPGHPAHRPAVRLLTSQSVSHAQRCSLPLVGNVIHPSDPVGAARADQVVRALEGSGWAADHVFWTCSLTALEEAS
jgi:hypothetical protein